MAPAMPPVLAFTKFAQLVDFVGKNILGLVNILDLTNEEARVTSWQILNSEKEIMEE